MTNREENKLSMYMATARVLRENEAAWSKMKTVASAIQLLEAKVAAISQSAAVQDQRLKGIAIDKQKLKARLADLAYKVASALVIYAQRSDNSELLEKVSLTRSDLIACRDTLTAERSSLILERAQELMSRVQVFGLTPELVRQLETTLGDYKQRIAAPRSAASHRVSITQTLKKLFTETDEFLKKELDRLMVVNFKDTDSMLFDAYTASRVIVDLGKSSFFTLVDIAPGETRTVQRVVPGSVLTNTGNTALVITGDHSSNEDGVELTPGDNMVLQLSEPVITVRNAHQSLAGQCRVRVSSLVPKEASRARTSKLITVTVGAGSTHRVERIVPGSEVTNTGPAAVTVCDCNEPDCGITDDDQPCGYEQTIEAAMTGILDTEKDHVNISNKDSQQTAKIKIRVFVKPLNAK
jgi:hypothetical protein